MVHLTALLDHYSSYVFGPMLGEPQRLTIVQQKRASARFRALVRMVRDRL